VEVALDLWQGDVDHRCIQDKHQLAGDDDRQCNAWMIAALCPAGETIYYCPQYPH
jgi:hypothetical protein